MNIDVHLRGSRKSAVWGYAHGNACAIFDNEKGSE